MKLLKIQSDILNINNYNKEFIIKVTEILIKEHDNIVLKMVEVEEKLNSRDWQDLEYYKNFISFCQDYADIYHHAKEEEIYFPWIYTKEPMMKDGPIHCMLKEHNQTRELIQKTISLITNIEEGDIASWNLLKDSIHEYCVILSSHIDKENNMLYRMANQLNNQFGDGDDMMLPLFEKENLRLAEISNRYF